MKVDIRRASVDDAAVIAEHRVAMFREMGQLPSDDMAVELLRVSVGVIAGALADASYIGWLATDEYGNVVAGAGVHVKPQLPRLTADGRIAAGPLPLVVNVFTEPDWRGQGVARALMRTLMQWATEQGCDRVLLHASQAGRPLYESLGFVPTNEMRWAPEPHAH